MEPRERVPREDGDRLAEAVRLLLEEVRARVARHPAGHLLGPGEVLELGLALPTGRNADPGALAAALAAGVDAALAESLALGAALRPGRAFCLRCGDAGCEHATPPGPRQVFAGYGATGLPLWVDLAQILLERADPRVDRLFANPPVLLAHTLRERDLGAALLPAWRDHASGFRLHGQVVAGWFRLPDPSGRPQPFAVTFQVVSTGAAGGRPRWGLNVLGAGPEGQPLEHLADRLGAAPWADAARWAQGELAGLERGGSPGAVLDGLAQRLEKPGRAAERRTGGARRSRPRRRRGDPRRRPPRHLHRPRRQRARPRLLAGGQAGDLAAHRPGRDRAPHRAPAVAAGAARGGGGAAGAGGVVRKREERKRDLGKERRGEGRGGWVRRGSRA